LYARINSGNVATSAPPAGGAGKRTGKPHVAGRAARTAKRAAVAGGAPRSAAWRVSPASAAPRACFVRPESLQPQRQPSAFGATCRRCRTHAEN